MRSHYFWEQNNISAFTQLAFQLADAKWDFYFQDLQKLLLKKFPLFRRMRKRQSSQNQIAAYLRKGE